MEFKFLKWQLKWEVIRKFFKSIDTDWFKKRKLSKSGLSKICGKKNKDIIITILLEGNKILSKQKQNIGESGEGNL